MMTTMQVLDLRRFKEAMDAFGTHSLFVRQILNSWPTGYSTKLERLGYSRGPCGKMRLRTTEQRSRLTGIKISQDQILGEGNYADVQDDLHMMIIP